MNKYLIMVAILISVLIILPTISGSISARGEKTPIKHLINIYFENHTFDNFFGTYPGPLSSTGNSTLADIARPINLWNDPSILSSMNPVKTGIFNTPDPIEGYSAYHTDWNHGAMNNFVNGSGPYSMTYFTQSQVGPLWGLAEEYSMADMYFSSTISESAPNTMYYLAGYNPLINDYGPPPSIPFSQTIMGELSAFNISWGAYIANPSDAPHFSEWAQISGMNEHLGNVHSWDTLVSQIQSGTLPSVSWVYSQEGNGTDQGPPSSILKGELWLFYLINTIEESPIWNSTAIMITWDDCGGYYDQVAPPVVDGVQLGFRVPFIVVSPFAKENYVSNTVLTHSSIIAFIDYNWNIPALNSFVSRVNVPIDMFDFNFTREKMSFDFGSSFPIPGSPIFSVPANATSPNLTATFPLSPQYNFSSLPYAKQGSTSFNLSSAGGGVFVSSDVTLMPFYASPYILLVLTIVAVLILTIVPRRRE